MKVTFHPQAIADYRQALDYYLDISPEIGHLFVVEIESGIDRIRKYPEAWALVEEYIRRHCLHRFPFGIYYSTENTEIVIYAILHMKRDPKTWQKRKNFS